MYERANQRVLQVGLAIIFLVIIPLANADNRLNIVGSWLGTATATDAPLPPVTDLSTFTSDGTIIETQRLYLANTPIGPLLRTPGHGVWEKTGDNEFAATIHIIYQGAENHPTSPGEVLAMEKARFKLRIEDNGNQLTGTLIDELRDLNDNVIFLGPGTFTATRILVEPLP